MCYEFLQAQRDVHKYGHIHKFNKVLWTLNVKMLDVNPEFTFTAQMTLNVIRDHAVWRWQLHTDEGPSSDSGSWCSKFEFSAVLHSWGRTRGYFWEQGFFFHHSEVALYFINDTHINLSSVLILVSCRFHIDCPAESSWVELRLHPFIHQSHQLPESDRWKGHPFIKLSAAF